MTSLGRILVVDDAASVRDILAEYLTDLGYTVDVAPDAAQALKLAVNTHPDLVLLDLYLRDIQGDAVFGYLRRVQPDVPVVILSARADIEDARALIRQGAFDYIAKPWDFDNLDRIVMAAFASRLGPDQRSA
jgi:DNA-binding NtrC family response regulator